MTESDQRFAPSPLRGGWGYGLETPPPPQPSPARGEGEAESVGSPRWRFSRPSLFRAVSVDPHTRVPLVRVASKAFVEGVILGEIVADVAHDAGAQVEIRSWLGDTSKTWNALLVGDNDVYCEYTGTLREEILSGEHLPDDAALREALAKRGLRMSRSLGFSNTYADWHAQENRRRNCTYAPSRT